MTHQPIKLHEIDFSQPDGEFIYKGQTYQIKKYSFYYFLRNKKHTNHEYIYTLNYPNDYTYKRKNMNKTEYSMDVIELGKIIENIQILADDVIQRCVQYKKALFSFGDGLDGQYYSPKDDEWIRLKYFKCNLSEVSLSEVLEKPYAFFVERAVNVYEQELPLIEDGKKLILS